MEYDGILKRADNDGCTKCIGYDDCDIWRNEINAIIPCGHKSKFFANADQLKGLIEEAEAGAQEWVRDNTLFVCNSIDLCEGECEAKYPHSYSRSSCNRCQRFGNSRCIPFRGTKGVRGGDYRSYRITPPLDKSN